MSRRRKTLITVLVALLLLGLVAIRWFSSSSQASITSNPSAQDQAAVPDKTFRDNYISFQYSGSYVAGQMAFQPHDLDVMMLRSDSPIDKQLAVSVTEGDATQSSGYILRKSAPETYSAQQLTVDGGPATIWIKNDNTEQSVYIQRGDKFALLSFSLGGTVTSDQLTPEVQQLLQTFRWQ